MLKSKEKLRNTRIKCLEKCLGIFENFDDDFINAEDARMFRTCEWFSAKKSYLKWRDFAPGSPRVFWVTGKPAVGKSILAGYAIGQLQKLDANCSYFFFKHGDKSKSRLSACLRSLAFQMACTNVQMQEALLDTYQNDIKFDNESERTIWRKLFLSGTFQASFSRHYWVIDAVDECVNFAPLFDSMLAKLDESIPLRILITSRKTSELERHFLNLGSSRFQSEEISTDDTLPDIKSLVDAKAKSLIVKNDEDRAALTEKILVKSEGSFLWTVLVLNELSNSHGEEEMNHVLEDVPRDMKLLYQRTLQLMSQTSRGKKLAKAILVWVVCASRPLTIKELDLALQLDVKDKFHKLKESIVALCGQLVTVDKFDKVKIVHETAREFLLDEDLESDFAINKTQAHTRIAKACLTYVTGEEMKPPRTSRRGLTVTSECIRAEFSRYACTEFSYHLAKADPLANDILFLVDNFLKLNILSWIDVVAQSQNLILLIRAAKHLKKYLNICAAERSPLGREMQLIRGWAKDLIRIAAKFGDALIMSPSAIYSLIPPFCPTESMVYNIAYHGRKFSIVGLSNFQWDDRLACISFQQGQTSAVCHGDEFFAAGLTTGTITLYHATSCQEYKVLQHGEAVKILQFKGKTGLMVSCGLKTIRVWDIYQGKTKHNFQVSQRFIGLAFDKNFLIAASSKNYLVSWDLDNNGAQQPNRPWSGSDEQKNNLSSHQPCAVSISVIHKMLAVAYSGRPILLWDFMEGSYYGTCGKKLSSGETSTHLITALVFNPNPSNGLLAASYLDGELVLIDPYDDQDLESLRADCHTLAASPDGRLLAGGAGSGTIKIFEFDTLKLLYQVKSTNIYIKQLTFSRDGLYFIDIRGSQCNVWEPPILLRDSVGEDSSEGTTTTVVEAVALDSQVKISVMILHPKGEDVFCGKDDGSVSLYVLKTGNQVRTFYSHRSLVSRLVWWPQSDIIMSVDVSNRIFAWGLKKSQEEGWVVEKMLFQSCLNSEKSVLQVFPGEAFGKFIVSTRESDHLWSVEGRQEMMRTCQNRSGIRKWIQHHQSPLHMICIEGAAARIYAWNDWSEVAFVSLTIDIIGLQLKSVTPYVSGHGRRILLELSELDRSGNTQGLHVLDAANFIIENDIAEEPNFEATSVGIKEMVSSNKTSPADVVVIPFLDLQLETLVHHVAHVIGFRDDGTLIFLNTHSWVCSVDLESLRHSSFLYIRHFFVPYDWFSGTRDIMGATTQKDVLFARNNNIAIIKNGLEYMEKVNDDIDNITQEKKNVSHR